MVQSNDIANLKNMPVINKRVAGGGAANGINFGGVAHIQPNPSGSPEEEKQG